MLHKIVGIIIVLICFSSMLYLILASYCASIFNDRFRENRKRLLEDKGEGKWPYLVCFKPLCGEDKYTFNNVGSFMNMFYPKYKNKVLFGIADHNDPAYRNVARVFKLNEPYRVIISLGEVKTGSNAKVRNMMNMERYIPFNTEIVLISDSDVRVEADYMKAMVSPFLEDPDVGATTCVYRIAKAIEVPEIIEAAFVGLTFIPSVLFTWRFLPFKYGFGASIAIRRDVLEKIGGFSVLKDYLADDYMLAKKVSEAGYKIRLAEYVVDITPSVKKTKEAVLHVLRWMRTIRACNPIGFFFSIICYPTLWGLISCLYFGPASLAVYLFIVSGFLRMFCSLLCLAGTEDDVFKAIVSPMWDLFSGILWFLCLIRDEVKWGEKYYKILSDGRFFEVKR